MNTPKPEDILATTAGYYDFSDPKTIYVRAKLNKKRKAEVIAHESFHRTFTSSTIYGGIFLMLDTFLRKHGDRLDPEDAADLLALRNGLIANMYFVQEGGAITRAYAMQNMIHLPTVQGESDQLHRKYVERLVPSYRIIAHIYISLILHLFSIEKGIISGYLFTYINDALGYFLMNPLGLRTAGQFTLSAEDSVLLTNEIAPDRRFMRLAQELRDPAAVTRFMTAAKNAMGEEFGCATLSDAANDALRQAMDSDPEHFEQRVHNAIHTGFEAVIPDFAVPLDCYEAYLEGLDWMRSINEGLVAEFPDYVPPKIAVLTDSKSKLYAAGIMRTFR